MPVHKSESTPLIGTGGKTGKESQYELLCTRVYKHCNGHSYYHYQESYKIKRTVLQDKNLHLTSKFAKAVECVQRKIQMLQEWVNEQNRG